MSKTVQNKIQAEVRKLIADGYLEDAFIESQKLSLRDKDRSTLTNLEAQNNQAKTDLDNKAIIRDEYTREINRIQLALLELVDKVWVEVNESEIDKIVAFFKKFWAVIGGIGVIAALLSDSKSIFEGCKNSPKNEPKIAADSLDCNFPKTFKDDTLYILITAFEDDAQKFSSDCFGNSLLRRIDAKKMPIKICYRPELAPKQREEVKRLQNKYNADLVLWGNLKNLSQNCGEGDICFKSLPSDTIIKICGGQVETEKSDLNYEKGISSEDIEQGGLHIGSVAFDSWIVSVFNAKVGKKKPNFFVVDESLPKKKQAKLWMEKGNLYSELEDFKNSIECNNKSIQLNPYDADAYINLGYAKSKRVQGECIDCKDAIADLGKAIQLNPNNAYAYYLRGFAKRYLNFKSVKNNKDAIVDLDKAIQLNPNDANAYVYRGSAKRDIKDYKSALVDYDKAIQLDSNLSFAYTNRGVLYRYMGDEEKSKRDFKRKEMRDSSLKEEKWYLRLCKALLMGIVLCFFIAIIEKYLLKASIGDFIKLKLKKMPPSV